MTTTLPNYVEIAHPGMDLIQKGAPLPIGSIHRTTSLKRAGLTTLINRIKQEWLIGRSEQEFKHWQNTGQAPSAESEPEIPVLPSRNPTLNQESEVEVAESVVEPEPIVEPEPEIIPETTSEGDDEPEVDESEKEIPPPVRVSNSPTRDGLTMKEYYSEHTINEDAKRPVAKCPHCKKTKRTQRKLFECCPGKTVEV